jgi:carboxyl-terminal processing protease
VAGSDIGDHSEKRQVAVIAQRLWGITELVLEKHIEPCTRQEMMLAGAKALLQTANVASPPDLARRVSALATREQVTAFLEEIWPKDDSGQDASTKKKEAAMLEGLLAIVPGKPRLLSPEDVKSTEQLGGNRYVGIGVRITLNKEEQLPQIVDLARRGAARRAGVNPGDLVLQVDGKSMHDVDLGKVVREWLRGEEGRDVTIVVRQPEATETRTLTMTRGTIVSDTVFGYRRLSEENWKLRVDDSAPIGYVSINAILSSTLHELRQQERRLQAEGVRALVLDLRSGDGLENLHHAQLLADGLLDGGVLWRLRDRGQEVKEYRADRESLFRDWPLAVLMNEQGTLEQRAVLAALQDNGRAILIGEPTGLHVYVSSLIPLPEGQGMIDLVTGKLERAAQGRGWPVQPDHKIPLNPAQKEAILKWLRGKGLSELPSGAVDQPPDDPQLARAIELLRLALKNPGQSGQP